MKRVLEQYGDDVLALVRDPVATALVPVTAVPPAHELVEQLTLSLRAPVHAGTAVADPLSVDVAHQESTDVLELALAIGLDPGAYTLDDVLVPYQLTRPGPGADRLRTRLNTLDDHPDWEATLRVFLRNGFDRQRTAAELHIHPNTVDYRLSRIAAISCLDATDPAQRLTAFAGLHLRDLDRYRARRRTDDLGTGRRPPTGPKAAARPPPDQERMAPTHPAPAVQPATACTASGEPATDPAVAREVERLLNGAAGL